MRQNERMQLGLAMAAVMLCFTTLVPVTQPHHAGAIVTATKPAQSLAEVCKIDATDDRVMEIVVSGTDAKSHILATRSQADPRFLGLATSINEAVVSDTIRRPSALLVVLYEQNGQPDYRLTVTKDGYLYDAITKRSFQPSDTFREFAQPLLEQIGHASGQ